VINLKRSLRQFPPAAAANALVKARWLERDAAVTRRRYLARARRQGVQVPSDDVALRAAVMRRVGQRGAALGWPKKKGDLHIFLAYPLTNWEGILPTALSAFGKVTAFEWRSMGFDETASNWIDTRDTMNRALLDAFHEAARQQPVDVVIAYSSGYTLSAEVFAAMAASGAVTTNFCFDDKVLWPGPKLGERFLSTAEFCSSVDLNLTSDPQGTLKYFVEGGIAMFHAEAADPSLHRPIDLQFEIDVSFIGARFGWRPALIKDLRRQGIEVECFGNGWPNGPVSNEAMRDIYAKSRINLGCGGVGYSSRLVCLKGRDFEVPMSGALYLTQHNPELSLVFDVGREIVTYRDPPDCARIIKELLSDRTRAASIRKAARERSMRDHTYEARWSHAFATIGALK
jgi:hypothetical protein